MRNPPRTVLPGFVGLTLLCLAAGVAHGQSSVPPPAGQRVVAVRVVEESGAVLEENPLGLALQPGQPFTSVGARESLRQLFRTGRYADLVAQTTPAEGGLRLDFVVQRNFYVNSVGVTGLQEPPSDATAVSSLRLVLGEVFRESDMPEALDRLRQTLEDEGLYQAKITYELVPHADTRQMDIAVSVMPGPRARVGPVTIVNQTPFSEQDLRGELRFRSNREITSEAVNRGVERTRQWLIRRGYLGARVSTTRGAYDLNANQVPLEVQVIAGLNIQVRIEGANISSGRLRQLLPLYVEGAVDEDLLEEGRRNLRDYFEDQGYFDVQVSYTTSSIPSNAANEPRAAAIPQGSQVITYEVNRGMRRRLAGLAFAGNRYFNEDILRSRVRIQPAAYASPGQFSTSQLQDDVTSITALYQANGFLQVQVKSEVVENYGGKMGDFFVNFQIAEGSQTRVAELKLEGNQALSVEEILRVIGSTPGQPYSDFNVAGDRANVLAIYYNQGFPEARFQAMVQEAPAAGPEEGPRVALVYHIDEGPQIRVANVLFDGEEHTRPGVIRREIQIRAGQPLSESSVVDTQRRLYGLGIFNRVSIAPQNPAGTDPEKTVVVLVEEARRYTIAYGLGFEAQRLGNAGSGPVASPLRFSPRATFEVTKINLTGRADTLSFKLRASTLQGRALLSYTAPSYFDPNWSLQLTGLFDKTRDVLTFTSTRTEGSVQLTNRLSPTTSIQFRYAYRRVLASDLQIAPQAIPLFIQPTEVAFFSISGVHDSRDSLSDPTRGTFNSVVLDYASRSVGSSASFLRATFENSMYTRIGRYLVFARSTRVAFEHPLGRTTSANIPLPERFFAGGGTTLRGFGLNQAGPRDPLTGFPIGGLAMLIFKQQLQFPMRLPFVGNRISGAVFYDAGNVFSTFGQITLRSAPAAPIFDPSQPNVCLVNCTNALNYYSHTVGLELRYHTPVAPVSIELAYQLNPARFLIPTGSTAGVCASTTCLRLARLPAFQFFVNLGSTF